MDIIPSKPKSIKSAKQDLLKDYRLRKIDELVKKEPRDKNKIKSIVNRVEIDI